jgi:HSP20 family molecular chaperone IbpA
MITVKAINNIYEGVTPFLTHEEELNPDSLYAEPITTATIKETSTAFKIELMLPDSATDTCKLNLSEGTLTVSGKGILEMQIDLLTHARKKFTYGNSYRGGIMPEWFADDEMRVTCKHRLLTMSIPKKELTNRLVTEASIN